MNFVKLNNIEFMSPQFIKEDILAKNIFLKK